MMPGERKESINIDHPYGQLIRNAVIWMVDATDIQVPDNDSGNEDTVDPGSMDPLSIFDDEFDTAPTLDDWLRLYQTENWSEDPLNVYQIGETGVLSMEPSTTTWWQNFIGPLVYKEVAGDFVVTTRVALSGDFDTQPYAYYTLAGLLVRQAQAAGYDAQSDFVPGQQNYFSLLMGFTTPGNGPRVLSNHTVSSVSTNPTVGISGYSAELRVARLGDILVALLREPGGEWQVVRTVSWPGMPETMQVGLAAVGDYIGLNSGSMGVFEHNDTAVNVNASLQADFEFVRFRTPIVPEMLEGVDISQLSDPDLLSFLGGESPPAESADTDGDGIGDDADGDDDGDGIPDDYETDQSLDPLNADDAEADSDGDGRNNYSEYLAGTDPNDADSILTFAQQFTPVGYHTASIYYWNTPYFGNLLWLEERNWWDATPGSPPLYQAETDQINEFGYPAYLEPGQILQAAPGQNMAEERRGLLAGRYLLTWQGEADIRIANGQFVPEESNSDETGLSLNGRRVYQVPQGANGVWVRIHAIGATPITEVRAWMPDPANPTEQSLEGELYHPTFLARLADRPWAFIRAMNLTSTNANPQQDWEDRRLPGHAFMNGVIHPRSPAPGVPLWADAEGVEQFADTHRNTGMAWEHVVALANTSGRDIWINVPHMATDEYILNLARLLAWGSNGDQPYDGPVLDPVYPPLDPNLRVFVEYSNEIWSGGPEFPQGNWAGAQAQALGISRVEFIARRFSELWEIFEQELHPERTVRVGAVFTSAQWYTEALVQHWYDPALDLLQPEILSPTSYFGHGLQGWVYDRNWVQDKCPVANPSWHQCAPGDHPYWTGGEYAGHLDQAFEQFRYMALSGRYYSGQNGADAVGWLGTFPQWLRDLALQRELPIVSYEGGPGFYTSSLDGPSPTDDGITMFVEELNRDPRMAEIYRIMLNQAAEKGLRTHSMFTDASPWGKHGQYGHLEHLDQEPEQSAKYAFLLDWFDEIQTLRHADDPVMGAVPDFSSEAQLPHAYVGEAYEHAIEVSGGDGLLDVRVIGESLPAGLSFNPETRTLGGTPTEDGTAYLYLRVTDADGEPAWRTFVVEVLPAVQNDLYAHASFGNADASLHLAEAGQGFSGAWWVQDQAEDEFVTQTGNDPGYPGLLGTGGAALQVEDSYRVAFRRLDVSGFGYLISSDNPLDIGRNGATLWVSGVVQRDPGTPLGNHLPGSEVGWIGDFLFGLAGENFATERRVMVGTLANGNFGLFVRNADGSRQVVDSLVSAVAFDGQPVALVLAIDYEADQSTVRLYVNPPVGPSEPSSHAVAFTTEPGSDLHVRHLMVGSTPAGRVIQEDIRLGDSFQAVMPSL